MAYLFPRAAFTPVRCGPAFRNEFAPIWSLFDDTFNELQRATTQAQKQFNPRFDVKEGTDSYMLEGEVPGVEQKDLSIEFTDEHTLTIKGRHESHVEKGKQPAIEEGTATPATDAGSVKSHQATVEDENAPATTTEVAAPVSSDQQVTKGEKSAEETHWVSERRVGEFSRSFSFPSRVNQDAVKASLKNGILSIIVPKAAAPASRRINID